MTIALATDLHGLEEQAARLERAQDVMRAVIDALERVILGQKEAVESVVFALVAGGHVLLEGAPGLGKTQLVRTLAQLIGGSFRRVQCTPDLMPSDILGTSLVVTTPTGGKDLTFRKGPVFTNVLLADEVNRATPRTQSALLEAMAEQTVTVEGRARPLPTPFFVLATENPIETAGVFPLPEAQLDRFLVKLSLSMPDLDTLTAIGALQKQPEPLPQATSPEELLDMQDVARQIAAAPHVERFAAKVVLATHSAEEVRYGAGPRGVQALLACGRAKALLNGRPSLSVDDVREVAHLVLDHRIILGFEAETEGLTGGHFVEQALSATTVESP